MKSDTKLSVKTLKVATLAISTLAFASSVFAGVRIVDEPYYKAVGNVAWHRQADIDPAEVIGRRIPNNMTSLVFIRRQDNDSDQTSANIAINDRFQVSLQPNGYTQVYSCAGVNFISAEQTKLKTNDLLRDAESFNLAPNGTYYFYVDVDDKSGNSKITQITKESADKILVNKKYQTHQISRVVPNCPTVKKIDPPIAVPVPELEKEVHIELEVLFDTDKHFIKPQFEHEVREVAEFMTAYPNTTAVVEGHTDSRAPTDYNQKLSERRANAVKAMLVNKFGINPSRLQAIGYGELRPRATNKTKEGRKLNRRVIAVINERVRLDKNGKQIIK